MRKQLAQHIHSKLFLPFILLLLFSSLPYIPSFFAYFQADEWYFFAKNFYYLNQNNNVLKFLLVNFTDPLTFNAHFTPFVQIIAYLQMNLFGTSFFPYQLMSIILHMVNTIAVFFFAYFLTRKNILFAFLAGLFFALNVVHSQAVTWVAASSTQIALLFSLGSLITSQLFYLTKKNRMKNISLILFILAIFTKETALFLFFVYPLLFYFQTGKKISYRGLKSFWVLAIVFFIIRVLFYIYSKMFMQAVGMHTQYQLVTNTFDISLLYKFITWPLKALVQVFIPPQVLYPIGELITQWGFPHYAVDASVRGITFLTFAQSAGIEFFMYPVAFVLVAIPLKVFVSLRKDRKEIADAMLIGSVIILSSVLPFLLIASSLVNLFGYITLLDSRHMYTLSVGAALLFAAVCFYSLRKTTYVYRYVVYGLIILWSVVQIVFINGKIAEDISLGQQRRSVLKTVFQEVPTLQKRTIFYVQSNTPYFGFASIPPFQTNLGSILIVNYYEKGQLPAGFLPNDFLTKNGLFGQGYAESLGKGFGYYLEEKTLVKDIELGKFSTDDIYAFFWDGQKKILVNITPASRQTIKEKVDTFAKFKTWKKYHETSSGIVFRYPAEMVLEEQEVESNNVSDILKHVILSDGVSSLKMSIRKNVPAINLSQALLLTNSFDRSEIKNIYGDNLVVLQSNNELHVLFPQNEIFITIDNSSLLNDNTLKDILQTITYEKE